MRYVLPASASFKTFDSISLEYLILDSVEAEKATELSFEASTQVKVPLVLSLE
jgi:hypothetical protein